MDFKAGLIILCGVFTLVCAAADFDWFMDHPKARFFVRIFGRGGTRAVYALLGLVLLGLGAFVLSA